jgi:hypothetical protein
MMAYSQKFSYAQAEWLAYRGGTKVSEATIRQYYRTCELAIVYAFFNLMKQRGKIGGPGKFVQIDESKVNNRLLLYGFSSDIGLLRSEP